MGLLRQAAWIESANNPLKADCDTDLFAHALVMVSNLRLRLTHRCCQVLHMLQPSLIIQESGGIIKCKTDCGCLPLSVLVEASHNSQGGRLVLGVALTVYKLTVQALSEKRAMQLHVWVDVMLSCFLI